MPHGKSLKQQVKGCKKALSGAMAVKQSNMKNGEWENFGPISRNSAPVGSGRGKMYIKPETNYMAGEFGRVT